MTTIHPELDRSDTVFEACGKCGGSGIYTAPSGYSFFTPTANAVTTGCFACGGHGGRTVTVGRLRDRARAQQRAAARREADAAAKLVETQAREAAAAQRAAERQAGWDAERAATPAVEAGRYEIRGVIVKVTEDESSYGYRTTIVHKAIVKNAAGQRFYLNLPGAIFNAEKGDEISVVATVTPSEKDHSFGFAKRPAKAELLAEASERECEGHVDDDWTLTSGAGIGEARYCDGSCR